MKKLLLIGLFLVTFFKYPDYTYALTCNAYDIVAGVPISSASQVLGAIDTATTTGSCFTNGGSATIQVKKTGTIVVKFQCQISDASDWLDMTDNTGTLITLNADGMFSNPQVYQCKNMRVSATTCTVCTVKAICNVCF